VAREPSDCSSDDVLTVAAAALGLNPATLASGSRLAELGVSSFATMKLVIELEEHFGVELTPDDLTELVDSPARNLPQLIERALRR
jgi:acyl carrier protein